MSGFGIQQIIDIANQLRNRNNSLYGQKGARPGTPNYVVNGFRNAAWDATHLVADHASLIILSVDRKKSFSRSNLKKRNQ